jgi:hypothetical protein
MNPLTFQHFWMPYKKPVGDNTVDIEQHESQGMVGAYLFVTRRKSLAVYSP